MATTGGAGVLDASWTAPTTNIDESPLMDLVAYRVYFGPSDAPCPGSSSLLVGSPTPSPPFGQTIAFRLAGLRAGTLYNVSVTAVDVSGAESACSTPAGARARMDFAVGPTGPLSLGRVEVGGFTEQTFTVSNTSGGTVTGSASVSAPFSLVSGNPFTLVGLGATQTVTVRFTPSAPAMATANVNFTANEDTVSRIVTGDGTDTIPPTLAITSPTGNAAYTTSNPLLTLGGTSSDNTGVTQVTWANDRSGGGTASGTTSWVASGIALQFGANVVTVTARDAAGNTATASLTVTLAGILTFTDDPLTAQNTVIRTVHIMELRAAIDGVRVARELAAFDWTDPALIPGSTPVKAIHVAELRTALSHAYEAAGLTPPRYSDPTPIAGLTVIKATDLNELRTFVRALE